MCLIYWALISNALAQEASPTAAAKNAYRHILNLQIDTAKYGIVHRNTHPSHIYLSNLIDIVRLLITERREDYESWQQREKIRFNALEKLPDNSPWKRFYQADIKLQWTLVKLKFGDELSAAWSFRKAYKLISENLRRFPTFKPQLKTAGILHILVGSIPEKYQWLIKLLGFEGSIGIGIQELKSLSEANDLFSLEAGIILALAYTHLLQDPGRGLALTECLANPHSKFILINYLTAIIQMKNNKSEAALKALIKLHSQKDDFFPLPTLNYFMGNIYLQKGKYNQAIIYLIRFLNGHQGENLLKDTYYKISLAYWLKGDVEAAKTYRQKGRIAAIGRTEADRYAASQLRLDEFQRKGILQLRLYTDGGYYESAENFIRNFDRRLLRNTRDSAEFEYRMARLSHKQGHHETAISRYKRTLDIGKAHNWYFLPNSALQLGHLFKIEGNFEKAEKHFRMALAFKNYPYENSINYKAKTALGQLNSSNPSK